MSMTLKSNVVASFTDAWIETTCVEEEFDGIFVASFTDAWIETVADYKVSDANPSHLLQMRGLKPLNFFIDVSRKSRIFYRCVD